jgi:hypothetical protein
MMSMPETRPAIDASELDGLAAAVTVWAVGSVAYRLRTHQV